MEAPTLPLDATEKLAQRLQLASEKAHNPNTLNHLNRRLELGVDEKNCSYFIKRKQRFCSHKCAAGNKDGLCSEHSQTGLQESRLQNDISRIKFECRERLKEVVDVVSTAAATATSTDNGDLLAASKAISNKRVSAPKRMANPFSIDLTPDIGCPDWTSIFSDVTRPVHIDVGCAKGRCIERLSRRPERVSWNHLGLEIRPDIVASAMDKLLAARKEAVDSHVSKRMRLDAACTEGGSSSSSASARGDEAVDSVASHATSASDSTSQILNLHFIACNFAASAEALFASLPQHSVGLISFQFPDPWRRGKHLKRLIVQPKLVAMLARHLAAGALVYISSDCDDVAQIMKGSFLGASNKELNIKMKEGDFSKKFKPADKRVESSSSSRPADAVEEPLSSSSAAASSAIVDSEVSQAEAISEVSAERESAEKDEDEPEDDEEASKESASNEGLFEMLTAEEVIRLADGSPTSPFILPSGVTASSPSDKSDCWLRFNPLDEPSERELVCEVDWRRVWRAVFRRTTKPCKL